jgi:hypothetical protein
MPTKSIFAISETALGPSHLSVLRLHKGDGLSVFGGYAGTTQHIYLGSQIDDRFAGVRFYLGATPLKHRRFNVVPGVSADFIVLTDVSSGASEITIDYDLERTTESTDEAVLLWGVDGWVRHNGHGIVVPNEGVEQTVMYEGGKMRLWYTRQTGGEAEGAEISYRESLDLGQTWSARGLCVSGHAGSFVRKGPDDKYHMLAMNWATNRQWVDYYRSDTGNAGTWALIQGNLLGLGPHSTNWPPFWRQWGNVTFYYDAGDSEWKVAIGHYDASGTYWTTSLWAGASLTTLVVVKNPLTGGGWTSDAGDLWPTTLAGKRWLGSHDAIPGVAGGNVLMPTQGSYWSADTLAGTWTKGPWWLKLQPFFGEITGAVGGYGGAPTPDVWSNIAPEAPAQIADLSHVEIDGRTFVAYEDQLGQTPPIASLSMASWDAPLARLLDPVITHARGDDLEAEGWSFEGGYGEPSPLPSGAWFRKMTRFGERTHPGACSPLTLEIHTSPTHGIRARRAVPAGQTSWRVTARPAQTSVRFMPLRLDADAANTILGGVWFGADGRIHYTSGAGQGDAGAYTAGTYYDLRLDAKGSTFGLWVNGTRVATDAAYASAGSPAYAKMELDAPAAGIAEAHIGTLYATSYAATAPWWGATSDATLPTATSATLRGWRVDGATVSVSCPTATVGSVTYPTSTTWECVLTDLDEGPNPYTVTSGGDEVQGTVTGGAVPHTVRIEAGGAPVTATLPPGADASGATATGATGSTSLQGSLGASGATATGATGSFSFTALFPVTGAAATGTTGSVEILSSDAGHRVRIDAGGAPVYADLVPGADASGAESTSAAGATALSAELPVTGDTADSATGSVQIIEHLMVTGAQAASATGSIAFAALFPVSGAQTTGATGSVRITSDAATPDVPWLPYNPGLGTLPHGWWRRQGRVW